MQKPNTLTLSPALFQKFNHLKVMGGFPDNQTCLKACFEAFERDLSQRKQAKSTQTSPCYMSHPGLSMDDYDT